MVVGLDTFIESDGLKLFAHVARPEGRPGSGRPGLVLAHGYPTGPRWVESSGRTYPEFADRIAAEAGWTVVAFNFRGTGQSEGDFSLTGWLEDLRAAVSYLDAEPDVRGVWLAGFRTGGALSVSAAADDPRVRGVATFGAPADFDSWAADPEAFLAHARALGVVRSRDFPPDIGAWAAEFEAMRPMNLVARIPPRPLLVVHGSIDDVVPLSDARILADTAAGNTELRVITAAGHRLRHDPRAVAMLLGWLDRQRQ